MLSNTPITLSDKLLRAAFENTLTATLFCNIAGDVVAANPAACRLFRCRLVDLIGVQRKQIVVSDEFDASLVAARRKNGRAKGFLNFKRTDGSFFRGSVDSKVITDFNGTRYLRVIIVDNTVEETLRRDIKIQEHHLNEVLKSGAMVMGVLTVNGNRKFISDNAHAIFGYDYNEELGSIDSMIYFEDREPTLEVFRQLPAVKQILNFENRIVCKDGSLVNMLWSYHYNDATDEIHVIGRDITQLKQTTVAMQQSEALLRTYLEQATDGLIVHYFNGKIVDVNQQACTNLGYSRKEMLQMNVTDVEVDFDLQGAQALWSSLEPNVPRSTIGRQRRKDGSSFPVEIQFGCFDAPQGRIYLAFVRDITERLQAEQLKLENERQFRMLIENMPVGVVKHTADGKIAMANCTALRLLGLTEAELKGRTALDKCWRLVKPNGEVLMPEEHPIVRAMTSKTFVGNVVMGVFRVMKNDWIWLSVSAEPMLTNEGDLYYVIGTLVDVTEQHKTNLTLAETNNMLAKSNIELELKTKELTAKNTELESFAYIASHDLQEPLRMITGFMQLLEKKYAAIIDEKGKQYFHFAIDGAKRMKLLIRDLLQYSLAGVNEMHTTTVDMNQLVSEALSSPAFAQDIAVSKVQVGLMPVIQADRSAMVRVMQNLLSNAFKYRHQNHAVITITAVESDNAWIICVKDNGIGIQPDQRDKLFTMFNRLSAKNEYAGTGMGLAICKRIVESHKGSIWFQSDYGGGSEFCFSIPMQAQ